MAVVKWKTVHLGMGHRGVSITAQECPVCFSLVDFRRTSQHMAAMHPEHHEAEQTRRAHERTREVTTSLGADFVQETGWLNPRSYRCSGCKATNVKFWRRAQTFNPEIFCINCLRGRWGPATSIENRQVNVGDAYVPAILAGSATIGEDEVQETYWGYTSIPQHLLTYWDNLPETRCQSDSDGDCDWFWCPQKVEYRTYCPLAKADEARYEAEGR